jgi:hypothetical protein
MLIWLIPKQFFYSETALPNEPNLVGSIYDRPYIKIAPIVTIPLTNKTKQTQAILVSDWLISKKSSPLKPIGQMNRNVVDSIYGRSSINNAHFFSIR